jgi:hypothetical protein
MIYRMEDLRYYLFDRETDWVESFQVIEKQHRTWNDREVILCALATSHAVSILLPGRQVTELLSCRGHLDLHPSLAEMAACAPFEWATSIHGLHYRFRLTLHDLRDNDMLLGSFPGPDQITIAYPKQEHLATPVTKIGWRIESRQLHIETLHTYPEDNGAVRSESAFEIA